MALTSILRTESIQSRSEIPENEPQLPITQCATRSFAAFLLLTPLADAAERIEL